jgi:hypothetical protein
MLASALLATGAGELNAKTASNVPRKSCQLAQKAAGDSVRCLPRACHLLHARHGAFVKTQSHSLAAANHAAETTAIAIAIVTAAFAVTAAQAQTTTAPPGADKSVKTRALEAGAKVLQRNSPLGPMDVYLVGFHPMKDHPEHQMEAHHFCHQVNEDFAQCALFDGNDRTANLTGIEYIISDRLFDTLPAEERSYWHPHNAEILSGQLVAPGIPAVAEKALMKGKMNSYGKTWHVWNTGAMGQPGDKLPLGPPMLAWSFNRDGEAKAGLVEQRDRRLGISTEEKRKQRAELLPLARPQSGVDDLRAAFAQAKPIPGVVDTKAASTTAPASTPGK